MRIIRLLQKNRSAYTVNPATGLVVITSSRSIIGKIVRSETTPALSAAAVATTATTAHHGC